MLVPLRRLLLGIALASGFAVPLPAQSANAFSVDLSVGPGAGSGDRNYRKTATAAAELVIAYGPVRQRGIAGAFITGVSGSVVGSDSCELNTSGECRPYFPNITHVGALAGYHLSNSNAAVRLMGGPVFLGGGGTYGLGGQALVDGAIGFKHIALVAAVRGNAWRSFEGETLYLRSFELGLRLQ